MDGPLPYIKVSLPTAMLAAVLLAPAVHDTMASGRARAFALDTSGTPLLLAYHWACHNYLRDCPFNIWHGD
jgi:hypothetical protein